MPFTCRPIAAALARLRIPAAVVTLAGMAGCNDPAEPPTATHLEIVQAPPPLGAPGFPLIDTIRVRLVDEDGTPQASRPITWIVTQGGGTATALATVTDANGIASARWTLGSSTGINRLEARTENDSVQAFQTNAEAFRVDRLDSNYGLACGLQQGDLWCWGDYSWVSTRGVSEIPTNPFGFYTAAPGLVSQGQGFTQVAVGFPGACALDATHIVRCFGPASSSVTPVPTIPAMRHIAGATNSDFCGLAMSDSTAWCWNLISGVGSPVPSSPALVDLEMDNPVGGSTQTACGRLVDSTAVCWGEGPLGDGTFNSSVTPVAVSGAHKFAELAVGRGFACGRKANGDVWCWGRNDDGQLGSAGPDSPVPVLATTGISRIAATLQTVMANQLGSIVRWGYFGNSTGNPVTPLASLAGLPVVDFAANDISCVRLNDGQAYCFDEMFINASSIDIDVYSPVQPVVEP